MILTKALIKPLGYLAILLAFAAHISPVQAKESPSKIYHTEKHAITAESMVNGLNYPWALAFLPDGTMLITERSGQLQWSSSKGVLKAISGLPKVWVAGQGGLLDVVVDPDFARNQTIYLSYAEPSKKDNEASTTVARGRLVFVNKKPILQNVKVIFSGHKKTSSTRHFGSRMVIAPDKTLYITLGDRGERMRAQDSFDYAGSVVRIHTDGSIPKNNPFVKGKRGLPAIWSIGHRNPQGAVWHPGTQSLWTNEHGARGGDEVNQPKAGKNYGWPIISYGRHYFGGKIGVGTHKKGMEQPKHYWDPSIAPSGFAYYDGKAFPHWRGNLFVGALAGQRVVRLVLSKNHEIVKEERMFTGLFGRIRDVRQGLDGYLYLLIDSANGKVIRLAPVSN